MNLKSSRSILCLWYALLVASAANVLQWQHHRQVTETLAKEIERLQAKANTAVMNEAIRK